MTSPDEELTPILEYPGPISPDFIRTASPLIESDTDDDETSVDGLAKSDNRELLLGGTFAP